jgi:HSP20 family protein
MIEKSTAVQITPEPSSVKLVEPKTLVERINQIRQDIARRAFQIFENGGGLFGRELDHWFQAEAELLHPVHVNITESDDALSVQAEVPGFNANEVEVSPEPRRLTISGKRATSKEESKRGKTLYQEQCSTELLRIIDLPTEVDARRSTATLKNGILELSLPKDGQAKSTRVEVRAV